MTVPYSSQANAAEEQPTFRDADAMKAFAIVAATIVLPYALSPLLAPCAVVYFAYLGVKALVSVGTVPFRHRPSRIQFRG